MFAGQMLYLYSHYSMYMESEGNHSKPVPIVPVHEGLRAIFIVILFIATLTACLLAFVFRNIALSGNSCMLKLFSMLSVFGGGVFLGTCLLDLLPAALESFHVAEESAKINFHFPIVETLIGVGFLMVLGAEQVLLIMRELNWIAPSHFDQLISHDDDSLLDQPSTRVSLHGDHAENETLPAIVRENHSTIRAVLLVLALSLHAVFEGLSLGLVSDVTQIVQIFFALMLHKTIIGLSLGIRLVQSKLSTWSVILCSLVFSSQILIGGFCGIAVLDFVSRGSIAVAALVSTGAQALACGTFLYITCFEILPHELRRSGLRFAKFICIIMGFSLIVILMAIFPDS